ncbi:MAG: isochorismate synthase [Acidimicrobiales bacterium]
MTLVARTRRLDHDVDLLTVAGTDGVLVARDGVGLAGRGTVLEIDVTDVGAAQAELAAITVDDEVGGPGTGPVAFGAWPFLPGTGRRLRVPEVIVGRDDRGSRWVTTVGDVDPTPALRDEGPAPVLPVRVTVQATQAADDWCAAVVAGRDAVRAEELRKVVLARQLVVESDRPFDRRGVLRRLAAAFPGCVLAAVDGFVCASPETLVSRHDDVVRSHPLAGTAPRGGDPTADARLAAGLLASAKDRAEHQVTIDFVHQTLLPWCSFLDEEAEPSVVGVANVQHLGTMVEGQLSDPAPSVLEMVEALHPTPAVGGDPRDAAIALIARLETGDRGRYAGPVGWVDGAGNGSWAVGIRSAELTGTTATLWAGVGIVADSDPVAELEETRAKLQAMLGTLVRL